MISLEKAKWELDRNEKYAIKWWNKNGYDGELKKQWITKTVFTIRKDGLEMDWSVYGVTKTGDMKKYMETFEFSFGLKKQVEELRKERA